MSLQHLSQFRYNGISQLLLGWFWPNLDIYFLDTKFILTHIFLPLIEFDLKLFQDPKFFNQKILDQTFSPQKLLTKILLDPKLVLTNYFLHEIYWTQMLFDLKLFWLRILWTNKSMHSKKIWTRNFFFTQHFFYHKFFLTQHFFWPTFSWPKVLLTHFFVWPKTYWTKTFLDQKSFVDPFFTIFFIYIYNLSDPTFFWPQSFISFISKKICLCVCPSVTKYLMSVSSQVFQVGFWCCKRQSRSSRWEDWDWLRCALPPRSVCHPPPLCLFPHLFISGVESPILML